MEERKKGEEMGEQEDGSVHLGERVVCASMVWCGLNHHRANVVQRGNLL